MKQQLLLTFASKRNTPRKLNDAICSCGLPTPFIRITDHDHCSGWLIFAVLQHEGRDQYCVAAQTTHTALSHRQRESNVEMMFQILFVDHEYGFNCLYFTKGGAGTDTIHEALRVKVMDKHG